MPRAVCYIYWDNTIMKDRKDCCCCCCCYLQEGWHLQNRKKTNLKTVTSPWKENPDSHLKSASTSILTVIKSFRYLAMQQLRLRASSSLYFEADTVEERHSKLLLKHSAKVVHHLCRPTWNAQHGTSGPHETRQEDFLSPLLAYKFCTKP